jgi:hypothetical protein
MEGDEARIIELWESAKRLACGPQLRGLQVDELVSVAASSADDVSVEVAVWTLSFSTIPKRRLHEVILRLLDLADDASRAARIRGQAAEGVGNLMEFTKQATLERTATLRLVRLLADASPEVRFWSAFSLGKLQAKSARAALRRMTSDETVVPGWWSVGGEAADALDRIDGREPPARTMQSRVTSVSRDGPDSARLPGTRRTVG